MLELSTDYDKIDQNIQSNRDQRIAAEISTKLKAPIMKPQFQLQGIINIRNQGNTVNPAENAAAAGKNLLDHFSS